MYGRPDRRIKASHLGLRKQACRVYPDNRPGLHGLDARQGNITLSATNQRAAGDVFAPTHTKDHVPDCGDQASIDVRHRCGRQPIRAGRLLYGRSS